MTERELAFLFAAVIIVPAIIIAWCFGALLAQAVFS